MSQRAELLTGSGRGRRVWRVGHTVRREVGPWTPAVHALLRHLETVGFDGAPRALGIDGSGREVLTFVGGAEGRHVDHDMTTLTGVARLIRSYHDAVAGFVPPANSRWRSGEPPETVAGPRIVCHNDLAPYNTIYRGGTPVALIDWDLAGPAPAVWDLAHASWTYVPLYTDADCARIGVPAVPRGPRLRRFCDAYGLEQRDGFLDVLRAHLESLDSDFARNSIGYLDRSRQQWESYLM